MRVFYAVRNHQTEDANLYQGLVQLGLEIVKYDPTPFHVALSPAWTNHDRARESERLVAAVRSAHMKGRVDLMFSYFMDPLVLPEAISRIRELGIVTVNYWCNSAHQFHLVDEISPAFDYCAVAEWDSLDKYRAVGATPIYFQMAANPDVYRPYDVPRDLEVSFVGQRYADRPVYIAHLLRHDIDVRVWGAGWTRDRRYGEQLPRVPRSFVVRHPRAALLGALSSAKSRLGHLLEVPPWDELRIAAVAGPSLPLEDLVRTYSRSQISLGFSTVGDQRYLTQDKIRQVHQRDFEAPMSGAMYFTERQEELSLFYELEREIVCYGSREELLDKVRFYLSHPTLADAIRKAGLERARRDHSWRARFGGLLDATRAPRARVTP